MEQIIQRIYDKGTVIGRGGQSHRLHSAISPQEGEFLAKIVHDDPGIVRTLEVGCAYGLSSLHICLSLRGRTGASHTIIDPFQATHWDGVGVKNLTDAGIDFFRLLEDRSEFVLPRLLEAEEGPFDLILIDGWHTFDHALLDCFYATRLLRVGGVLAIDDVQFPSVKRVVDLLKNYPCYDEYGSVGVKLPPSRKKRVARLLAAPVNRKTWARILAPGLYRRVFDDEGTEMIALRKTGEDERNWDWHADAF